MNKEIFFNKVIPEPNSGCWFWMGDTVKGVYGRSFHNGKKILAHRLSYKLHVGEISEGLTIDHLCVQPSCVNPKHLEPVTMKENIMRGRSFARVNAEKTHCSRGHEFTEENTYWYKKNRRRDCKKCMEIRYKSYYEKNTEIIKTKTKQRYHSNK